MKEIKSLVFCSEAYSYIMRKYKKGRLLHDKNDGYDMQNACQIDKQMPYHMKIAFLRLGIEESTDRIHNSSCHDQAKKR